MTAPCRIIGAKATLPEIADVDRHAVVAADDDIADVGKDVIRPEPADNLLLAIVNDIAAAGALVIVLERVEDILQLDSVGHERRRAGVVPRRS